MTNDLPIPLDAAPATPSGAPDLAPIRALREALGSLLDQERAMFEAGDTVGLSWGAAQVAALKADLGDIERTAKTDIAVLIRRGWMTGDGEPRKGKPKQMIDGLGMVEVESSFERKNWESEKLLRAIVMKSLIDPETGEIGEPVKVVDDLLANLSAALPITGSLGWRVGQEKPVGSGQWTGLRGLGFDPDDFCDTLDKPVMAKVPRLPDTTTPQSPTAEEA